MTFKLIIRKCSFKVHIFPSIANILFFLALAMQYLKQRQIRNECVVHFYLFFKIKLRVSQKKNNNLTISERQEFKKTTYFCTSPQKLSFFRVRKVYLIAYLSSSKKTET